MGTSLTRTADGHAACSSCTIRLGAGFIPEARGTQPPVSQPEVEQTSQTTTSTESRPLVTSTPAAGRGSRQRLKLQHYTGAESLEAFLRNFNSMKQYLQWNEDDALYHLCGSLEGAAGPVSYTHLTLPTNREV